jgi:RNA polymerase sigma-70 factor, ECF subfamily
MEVEAVLDEVSRRVTAMDDGCRSDSAEVQRGEQFMALYSGHQRRLYLYTMTLLPASVDAEDVLQEANLVLWRKFDQYQPQTNFFAWACQIIRYEVLKYREKRARAAQLLDPDVFERLAEVAISQVEHLDEFHRRALVDCMERLSDGDRDLMHRRYREAMEVRMIAASMNRSPNAVSKSLGRIRRLLLECINNDSTLRERRGDAI